MRKKIKLIFLSIGLSIALIAGIIEIGKILNMVTTQETTQDLADVVVTAGNSPKGSSFVAGSLGGANCSKMYYFIPGTYCARHEWEIARHARHDGSSTVISDRAGAGRAQEITYQLNKTTEMAQSLAYAKLFNASDPYMQDLVWASEQFKDYTGGRSGLVEYMGEKETTASPGLKGRSYQFANFIYKALDANGQLGLTFTPLADEDDSLRILVNQSDLTYTIGPYVLNFENQDESCVPGTGSEIMKDLVYNEIIEKNPGWTEENKFCSGTVEVLLTFEDNSHKLTDVGVEVLDASGNPIKDKFPKFGETFYLRYKTTLTEDIKYIRPSIQINHMKKLTENGSKYYVYTYKSKHIKYSMNTDLGGLLTRALYSSRVLNVFEGVHITLRAQAINDHWEIYTDAGFKISKNNNAAARLQECLNILWDMLKEIIVAEGADWGLSNLAINAGYTPCLYWRGKYYENPNAVAIITPIYKTTEWTITKPDGNTTRVESRTQPSYDQSAGESIQKNRDIYTYEARVEGIADMSGVVGVGDSEQGAINNLNDKLGEIRIAFKLNSLIIDEDILESQPDEVLDLVIPPKSFEEEEITVEEVVGQGGTGIGGKERLASSIVEEDVDYAVERATLPGKEINMYLGGNVWQDMPSEKLGEFTGVRQSSSLSMAGIQVQLYDRTTGGLIFTTTTDSEGQYGFQKLHPMHKYYVVFTYDGMRYEDTSYNNNLSGGYSTAQESSRESFNDQFDEISSSPQNYNMGGSWRKAYRSVHEN